MDECRIPAVVCPNEIGDEMYDIETMIMSYHSITRFGYCFSVHAFKFASLTIFFDSNKVKTQKNVCCA